MVFRPIRKHVVTFAHEFKALAITGPRQSGKTTLARQAFPKKTYATLEDPGLEVDFLIESGGGFDIVECKSGQTQASDWFSAIQAWTEKTRAEPRSRHLVYGGDDTLVRQGVQAHGWQTCASIIR